MNTNTTPAFIDALTAYQALKQELVLAPFTKDKSGHGYKYVTLEDIQRVATPMLAKHNLILTDELGGEGDYGLTTTLYYIPAGLLVAASTFRFNITPALGTDKRGNPTLAYGTAQDIGGWRTYAARYNRATLLDLVLLGEDDDGAALNRAEGGATKKTKAPAALVEPNNEMW